MSITADIIVPIAYTSFLIGIAVAYIFRDRYNMRQLCVAVFIFCLVVVNIGGVHVFPFISLQKYTYQVDDTKTQYEIRVVDDQGQELRLDPRAVEPIRPDKIAHAFALDYTPEERNQTFSYIYSEVTDYREEVESNPGFRLADLRFPEHDVGDAWSRSELQQHGPFVAVRIYKVEKTFVDDNTDVKIEDEQVYEWSADDQPAEEDA